MTTTNPAHDHHQSRVMNLRLHLFLLLFLSLDLSWSGGTRANAQDTSLQLNDDVLGLIVFKSDLNNPPPLSSWTEDDNSPCSWSFVQCDPTTRRVTEVSLDGLGLSGKLGRGLERLDRLVLLSLSHNKLTGILDLTQFPPSLQTLNLSHNRFSGQIPSSIASTTSIRFLDLSANLFTGPVPQSFFQSCSLHSLSLGRNSLNGPLPTTLPKCTTLNSLDLSSNQFSGNPFSTGEIWSLNHTFSGPIPVGIFSLHYLKELRLQDNQFTGLIPLDVGLCPHLHLINLSRNRFKGALPESLKMLNSLTHFYLSTNKITGDFPRWISSMTSLEILDLSSNTLTGTLPTSLANLRSLQQLILSNNNLGGVIPTSLVSCTQLSVLHLAGNAFSGSIPEDLFGMGLQELDLSWNQFTRLVPSGSSRKFDSLTSLDLSGNKLKGDIPSKLGLFSNLRYLNLSWNDLHSRIPHDIGYLQNLTVLDLRHASLYGSIPGDVCDSGCLRVLQLDGNSLEGSIPTEIGHCSSLQLLSLSQNKLSGPIPISMAALRKLEILKLEENQLSGQVPNELGTLLKLVSVNISYNRLVGRLPAEGIFPSLDATSIQGNQGICSPVLSGPCMMTVPKPLVLDPNAGHNQTDGSSRGSSRFHRKRFLSSSALIAMSAAVVIAVGVLIITLLNAGARRRHATVSTDQKNNALESMYYSSSSMSGGMPSVGTLVLFDSNSKEEYWDNIDPEKLFHKANEIGGGAIGSVYRAALGAGGPVVAVKKLLISTEITKHAEEFDREVRVLGRVRHPHVLPLRGYHWTPQLQFLVSDYMAGGNLQSKLHERPPSMPPLSWSARFRISLGTAKGLAHLHHSCNPPIIHYNLKPNNILLDERNNPRLSDFGMVRILGKMDKQSTSRQFHGAVGYVAPEMACQSLRVNEKCDVYGFGVMVLELVTGRKAIEYGEDNVVILSDHVRVLLEEENVLDCVDQSMGAYPEEEVLPVLKLALVCTSRIPSCRPSMAEVVQILQVITTPIPQRTEGC